MGLKLTVSILMLITIPTAHPWDRSELLEDIKEYRAELNEELLTLKKQEKTLIHAIKVWKAQKKKAIEEEKRKNLALLKQEFQIKMKDLSKIQEIKNKRHQILVHRTYIRSVELKEERFKRRREIYDQYYSDKANLEKEYMDKYHNVMKAVLSRKMEELNDNLPDFFPRLAEVQNDNWLYKQYCKEQKFFLKQQAKLDHKSYLFDLTVPMRKKREEVQALYKLAKEELNFYKETYSTMVQFAQNTKGAKTPVKKYEIKLKKAKNKFFKSEHELKRLQGSIDKIARNLMREKGKKKIYCDASQPIVKIRMVE